MDFLADGDAADEIVIELVAEAGLVANRDGAVRRGFHRGLDDVALPVALAGRDIAGQHEIRQRGERDVVRAADARFQHAAAPHRNAGGLRDIVHALRFGEAAHAAQLDIDDAAGAQSDRLLGVMRGADAFVQADGRLQLRLQLGVIDDVVVRQRLLDHHQVELVELLQDGRRRPACRRSWRRPSA